MRSYTRSASASVTGQQQQQQQQRTDEQPSSHWHPTRTFSVCLSLVFINYQLIKYWSAMNNYSYHTRDWSSVSERSVYQLHGHGTVFLSTVSPPTTPLHSRRNWRLSFSVKHFSFPPPCSLDYHSFIHSLTTLSVQGWSAPAVSPYHLLLTYYYYYYYYHHHHHHHHHQY